MKQPTAADPTAEHTLGCRILDRYQALVALRSPWEALWNDIARYVIPHRVAGMSSGGGMGGVSTSGSAGTSPTASHHALLFDTTAVQANMTLANGQLAWMSPMESPWFAFEPQRAQRDDEARRWLAAATTEARGELATSNFYTQVHEFYLDRGGFGTSCLYVEPGKKNLLNVQVWPCGTFVFDEDDEGNVDTVMRSFRLTPRQAVQKFGAENVSEKMREWAADAKRAHDRVEFIHAIYPREDAEARLDPLNMPVASVYLEKDQRHICKTSGYEEMPAFVSRYLEWGSATGQLYGWAPGFAALPEARQLNFLQEMMDAMAEKAAFPPVLAPEELEGEIDPNAMGVTYFSKDLMQANSLPKEWMTQGRYDVGLNRIQERQRVIKEAFHVDLFQMFGQLTKQMTAREVAERSQEKLIQFSPTFARLTTELFNPLLERVFGILLRAGRLGQVPESLMVPISDTQAYIPPPRLRYSSRIALSLSALPSIGYAKTLDRLATTARLLPQLTDNYDFDKAEREAALADGMSAELLIPEAQVTKTREARAARQAQAEQMQMASAAADMAAKAGRIPPDSVIGRQLQQGLAQAGAATSQA